MARLVPEIVWVATPEEADVLLVTGPVNPAIRETLLPLLVGDKPVIAVGNCAISGHPFGRGGLAALGERVRFARVEGCPIAPEALSEALRTVLNSRGHA